MADPKSFICGVESENLSLEEAAFLHEQQPYGVILFARNCIAPNQVRQLVCDIKNELTHPFASILIDQEGGRVARLKPPHWRAYPSAAALAEKDDATDMIALNARLMADDLRALGITTDCAPLADVPAPDGHDIIGDRAFGATPEAVIAGARAQTNGLQQGGILPVLKHIPGHGRATADSHLALPEVHASREALEATDFAPFKALADLPLGMTAHILYHALDTQHVSTFSKQVISLIRDHIGFDGLLMSDDLSMKALSGDFAERTARSLQAGCDLALHCNGNMAEMQAVAAAAATMPDASLVRAQRALDWLPNEIAALPDEAVAQWEAACAA